MNKRDKESEAICVPVNKLVCTARNSGHTFNGKTKLQLFFFFFNFASNTVCKYSLILLGDVWCLKEGKEFEKYNDEDKVIEILYTSNSKRSTIKD